MQVMPFRSRKPGDKHKGTRVPHTPLARRCQNIASHLLEIKGKRTDSRQVYAIHTGQLHTQSSQQSCDNREDVIRTVLYSRGRTIALSHCVVESSPTHGDNRGSTSAFVSGVTSHAVNGRSFYGVPTVFATMVVVLGCTQ